MILLRIALSSFFQGFSTSGVCDTPGNHQHYNIVRDSTDSGYARKPCVSPLKHLFDSIRPRAPIGVRDPGRTFAALKEVYGNRPFFRRFSPAIATITE